MKCKWISFYGILFFAASLHAQDKSAESEKNSSEIICTKQNDVRKLWILNENSGCKVIYLKDDSEKPIGSQKSGTDFCLRLIDKVKSRLETIYGFECKSSNETK